MSSKFKVCQPKPRRAAVEPLQQVAKMPGKKAVQGKAAAAIPKKELGGPSGPEPTRYGDWERKGICVDF